MNFEVLSKENIVEVSKMMHILWPESTESEEMQNCHRILESKLETCYVANDNGEYVGFIYLSVRNDHVEGAKSLPLVYVEGIYVNKSARRKGIGKKLLEKAKEYAIENACSQIGSDAEIGNRESILFHIGSGFKEANKVVCFIQDV